MSTSGAEFVQRCGDYIYNNTQGKYSINQFISLLKYYAPENLAVVAAAIGGHLSETAMSDMACAIETKTGYSPLTCFVTTGALAYGGLKAVQFACNRFKVKTPHDLFEPILTKYAGIFLSGNLKDLSKLFESVIDVKVASVLKEIQNAFPDAFKQWSDSFKNEVKAAAKNQQMKALPALLEQNKDAIKTAFESSTASAPLIRSVGMQESASNPTRIDLKSVIFDILYSVDKSSPSQVISQKLK